MNTGTDVPPRTAPSSRAIRSSSPSTAVTNAEGRGSVALPASGLYPIAVMAIAMWKCEV